MERFIEQHNDHITGVLSGYDRVLFRGTLRSISYVNGMDIFLSSRHVLYKEFGSFAEKLSNRLKAHAESVAAKARRPLQYISSAKASKEDIARKIMKQDNIQKGLICVLSCVEPCQTFNIRRDSKTQQLRLVSQERKCLHLYFYLVDRAFGFMHLRLQTWLPFAIQVYINGREWLARQLDAANIAHERYDNCFTWLEDVARTQRIFDGLIERKWAPYLNALAKRVNPWIDAKQGLDLHGYYWSIRQDEYATDVMFSDAKYLKEIYPKLTNYAIQELGSEDILRFLERRTDCRFQGEVKTILGRRPEGLRIKHWVEENSIKMYDKGGTVLRIETTINNPRRFKVRRQTTRKGIRAMRWIRMRKGVADISRRSCIQRAANERYLEALAVVGQPAPTSRILDPVSKRKIHKGRSYRALRPISPEDTRLFRIVIRGPFLLQGFRNADLRRELMPEAENDPVQRRKASARMSRLLRLLRSHGLIRKISGTRYYRITKKGNHVITTSLRLREIDVQRIAA
jgi:hypothetical protein